MKKNLIVLLVIALVSVGLFAANPGPSTFDVTTTVEGINEMKLTQAEFTGTTKSALTALDAYTGPLEVSAYGPQSFTAYISTLSNSRVGYKVTMSETAMADAAAKIHYTVTANGESVDTSGAENGPGSNAKVIIDTLTSGMTGVASQSHLITLSVDQTSFEAAVEGEYSGTVTFTWTAS